jgi:hypothetical protein
MQQPSYFVAYSSGFLCLLFHLSSANDPCASLARKGSSIANDFKQVESSNTFLRLECGPFPGDRLVHFDQKNRSTHSVRETPYAVSAAPGPSTDGPLECAGSSSRPVGDCTSNTNDLCRVTEADDGQIVIGSQSDVKLRPRCGRRPAPMDHACAVTDQAIHASSHLEANRDRGLDVAQHVAATSCGAMATRRCVAEADATAHPLSVQSEISRTPRGWGGHNAEEAGAHGGNGFCPWTHPDDGEAQGCDTDHTAAARLPPSPTPDPGVPEHAVHTTRPSSLPGGAVTGAGAAAPPSLQYPQHRCSALELFQALCVGLVGLCLRGRLHGVLRSQPSTLPHYNESTASAAAEQDWRQGATRRANPAKVGCPRCWLCASSFANHDVCCAGPSYAG